ncbi:MAG: penicillin-binding transpeptidase domain-containing protein [Polyangiaceae bacterium]
MAAWSKWIGVGTATGIILALVPVVRGNIRLEDALSKATSSTSSGSRGDGKGPNLKGLDLLRLRLQPRRVTSPLPDGRTAELTLDPALQRAALSVMKKYRVPEAGAVLMDVKSGELLVYASYVNEGPKVDLNVQVEAPVASVFKVVTASALVENAHLTAKTEQCYHGGRSRIAADELEEDPARDKWCATLAAAMGRSLNVVFARLAQKHLTPEELEAMAGSYGFNTPIPFDVPTQKPTVDVPAEPLEFARTSAGFWHSKMSPLQGVSIAQTVANSGVAVRPRIVRSITKDREVEWEWDGKPEVLRRTIKPETAKELTRMMLQTVHNGSAYKQFHDKRGHAFIPNIHIAGKTGTLTAHKANRHYTWFVGFAPAEKPEVAVSVLVVNTPIWRIKGPMLAREVLRAYFEQRGKK